MTFFEWYAQVLQKKIIYRTLSTTQTVYLCVNVQRARVRTNLKWCKLFDLINIKSQVKRKYSAMLCSQPVYKSNDR